MPTIPMSRSLSGLLSRAGISLNLLAMLLTAVVWTPSATSAQDAQTLTSPKGITPNAVTAGSAKMLGPMAANQMLRFVIALRPPHQAEEEKFIQDLMTKGSPSYGRFLTPEEWNARFSPSAEDEQAVVDWAKSQGFTITNRFPNRLLVDVEAPVATIEKALNLKMNRYQMGASERFSSDRDPQVPVNLIGIIQNVQGLNNINMLRPMRSGAAVPNFPVYAQGPAVSQRVSGEHAASAPKPKSMTGGGSSGVKPNITGGAYDPTDIYSSQAYDVQALYNQGHCCNPLGNAGSTPKETSIAIVTAGAQDPNDFTGFHNTYPYLADHWVMVGIDGQTVPCNPSTMSCDGEGTMDFEWSTAMSNSFGSYVDTSLVVMYDAVDSRFSTFNDAYNRVLSDNSTRVLSTSWGCEETACYDNTDMNTTHNIFNNLVGTGWTLVSASGDQGATAGCGAAVAVQYPSSDPDMVGAGGTTLHLDSSGNFVSQTAWSGGPYGCGSNDGGSTGGVSSYWGVPGYQSGMGYSGRAVPDLALNADWYNTPQNLYFGGGLSGNGGTSIVAPELAGIFAQLNAYLLTLGNNCLNEGGPCAPMGGLVNSMVYYLGNNPTYAVHSPFYDITSGCNNNDYTAFYGLSYYCAGTGYDPVTGWGSFNALQLAWGINTYRAGDFGNPVITFSGPISTIGSTNWFNTDQTVSWTVSDTSGLSGYAANGVAGFSQAWDSAFSDPSSEATPGSGNSFYSGPQFPNATSGYLTLSSAGQGCHYATVDAWDNSGFTSGNNYYYYLCYDTVAPTISIANSPAANSYGWNKTSVTVTITPADPGGTQASGIKTTYYAIDTGACYPGSLAACTVYSGPFVMSATGSHYVYYFTVDNAGNYSSEPYEWVYIDETAPVTSAALSGTLNGTSYDTAVTVTLSATDSLSGVQATYYQLDGGALTTYSAPFSVSSLGSHTVKFYSVDKASNTEATKSVSFSIVALTTTALTVSPNPVITPNTVTLTATVTASPSGTPTGTVTFYNGATAIGTGTLAGGVATLTTTTLPTGKDSLTVAYPGATNFLASTSSAVVEIVRQHTTTSITSSVNPSAFNQSVTFTAHVTPSISGTATGTIQFRDGATTLATVALSSGTATFTTSTLSVGSHSMTAYYSGDQLNVSSTSAAMSQVVNAAATTTALTASPNPVITPNTVTLTATVTSTAGTPTGTVTFYNGATSIGTATLSGGVATLTTTTLPAGKDNLTATYAGATNFLTSTSAAVVEIVRQHTTTAITSSLNPSNTGQSVTFTAKVTPTISGTATGTIQFRDGATTLATVALSGGTATFTTTALSVGTHSMTAYYSGDQLNVSSTSSALSQVVNNAVATTTALAVSPNPVITPNTVTLTATVSSGGGTPTGTVTFYNGATSIGTATLSGGVATLTTTTLPAGKDSLTATYGGATGFLTSTSPAVVEIVRQRTTTTIASSLNPSPSGQNVTFTAVVTPTISGTATGTIQFRDGATTLATVALSGGTATFTTSTLSVGTHSMTAYYSGDQLNVSSTSAALSQVVNVAATTTVLTVSPNPVITPNTVTLTATVTSSEGTPTGTVTFYNGATSIGTGTLSGGVATLTTTTLPAGKDSLTATYAGATGFLTSTSAAVVEIVRQRTTTAITSSLNPSNSGQSVTFTAKVTPTISGTATGTIQFRDGATTLATVALSGGTATFTTSTLSVGSHSMTAYYSGDQLNVSSTSAALTQTVH